MGSTFKFVNLLHHLCLGPALLYPQLPPMLRWVTLDHLSLLLVEGSTFRLLMGLCACRSHHLMVLVAVLTAILEPGRFDPELKHLAQFALFHRKLVT